VVPSAVSSATGSLFLNDAGGRGFSDDIILLLSIKGPIADNFSVNIKSSGYTWTPATPGAYNPLKPTTADTGALGTTAPFIGLPIQGTGLTYQPLALDEVFTKADFLYGPQTARPGPGGDGITPFWNIPFIPGQLVTDPTTAEYLMFIDLKAGAMRDITLTDNGAVKVEYTINNFYGDAAFNMYAWVTAANQGEGISFTNPVTNGYSINYTGPPAAGITYSAAGPYRAGTPVTITAEFSKPMVDAPAPMIAFSGADTLGANVMTKVDATHYSYTYTAGSGDGTTNVLLSTGTDLAGQEVISVPISGASFTLANSSPSAALTYSPSGPYAAGTAVTITATFSKEMSDAPVTQIALSGADTLAATGMTKIDTTHYTYTYTAGTGNGDVVVTLSNGTDLVGNPLLATPSSGKTFTINPLPMGNMSGGAEASIGDALMALRTAVGLYDPTPQEFTRGNVAPMVNGKPSPDNTIDISDALTILKRVVGLITW